MSTPENEEDFSMEAEEKSQRELFVRSRTRLLELVSKYPLDPNEVLAIGVILGTVSRLQNDLERATKVIEVLTQAVKDGI